MSIISTAIGSERISRVSGYKIKKGFFDNNTTNLNQVIAVFGEANTANQSGLDTDGKEVTSAQEAGELYGFGSPIHQQMRILRPVFGDGVGGIPTVVFPQVSDVSATATSHEWTVTGTATANATHFFVVNGRQSVDFVNYDFSVVKGDTANAIAQKMADAINGVLSSPVIATVATSTVTLTTKWAGQTSASLKTRVNFGTRPAGIAYAKTTVTEGAGAVDLAGALSQFGNTWYTLVTNPYGESVLGALEDFNGVPDEENPTGNYEGRTFRPFLSVFGSTLDDKDDIAAITDAPDRVSQVTNVLAPAPKSEGFECEAAANAIRIFARIAQDTPHLDVNNKSYPDMPTPLNGQIGDMADYNNRDFLVKKGASTVLLENGAYVIQDFVTTYHPEGETPLQYAYPRDLVVIFNVRDGYRILENRFVRDHVLIQDDQLTDVPKAIKPIEWKSVLIEYFRELTARGLIKNSEFSENSLRVEINANNPNRLDTSFSDRKTGIARILSTDVTTGF